MVNDTSTILKLDPYNSGQLLQGIFIYQKALMEKYILLDRLPALPLDINVRENQKFLRKLVGDFNEEMAEASTEYDRAMIIMAEENYTQGEHQLKMECYLSKMLEELADALHFITELMIYTNIEPEDIKSWYKASFQFDELQQSDGLGTSLAYARNSNIDNDKIREGVKMAYHITSTIKPLGFELHEELEKKFWMTAKTMLIAQNCLKIKDWRAAEVAAAVNEFQNRIVWAWHHFMCILDALQITPLDLYKAYEDKNLICQQRIIEGY